MEYDKWLEKVANLKLSAFYVDENKRAFDSILYNSISQTATASNAYVLLQVYDKNISSTSSLNVKSGEVSTGRLMPHFPMYERIVEPLLQRNQEFGLLIAEKVVKTRLSKIKNYKKAVRSVNTDEQSGVSFLSNFVNVELNEKQLTIRPIYDNLVDDKVLFDLGVRNTSSSSVSLNHRFNPDYILLCLEFIADVQRYDNNPDIKIYLDTETNVLTVSNATAFLVIVANGQPT